MWNFYESTVSDLQEWYTYIIWPHITENITRKKQSSTRWCSYLRSSFLLIKAFIYSESFFCINANRSQALPLPTGVLQNHRNQITKSSRNRGHSRTDALTLASGPPAEHAHWGAPTTSPTTSYAKNSVGARETQRVCLEQMLWWRTDCWMRQQFEGKISRRLNWKGSVKLVLVNADKFSVNHIKYPQNNNVDICHLDLWLKWSQCTLGRWSVLFLKFYGRVQVSVPEVHLTIVSILVFKLHQTHSFS